MARPYQEEIDKFSETFSWVGKLELCEIIKIIRCSSKWPLYAIGSGGSLSAAVALADLHNSWTKNISKAVTTFQASNMTSSEKQIFWLLSASGNNSDINTALDSLVQLMSPKIAILTCKANSKLLLNAVKYPTIESFIFSPPAGKDGFLATNSLLAFVSILTRAYCEAFNSINSWIATSEFIKKLLSDHSIVSYWKNEVNPLLHKETLVVLYGRGTNLGAFDLESKFIEAALGNIQLADFRNFAHGRHNWLAKRGSTSAILAIYSNEDKSIAEKTLSLLPKDIPVGRIFFETTKNIAPLASLIFALYATKWAGEVHNIDPGRPGVPDFGRRLYHLSLPIEKKRNFKDIDINDQIAIERKSKCSIKKLDESGKLDFWKKKLFEFKCKLKNTKFSYVILDYDGTVVDTNHRFNPPNGELIEHILSLLRNGIHIGFATGRGQSIRFDLQKVIPKELWNNILIGYYNGAEISYLDDDSIPTRGICIPELEIIKTNLENIIINNDEYTIEFRKHQIIVKSNYCLSGDDIINNIYNSICATNLKNIKIYSSDHSVDIIHCAVSKNAIVDKFKELYGDLGNEFLVIGDKGMWPGNDYELLSNRFSLSVDTTNSIPDRCWNLGKHGLMGTNITQYYLRNFSIKDNYFSVILEDNNE